MAVLLLSIVGNAGLLEWRMGLRQAGRHLKLPDNFLKQW